MAAAPARSLIAAVVLGVAVFAHAAVRFSNSLRQPDAWYATAEARAVAANMLLYQTPEGGWPTDVDTAAALTAEFLALKPASHAPTIDDGATTVPRDVRTVADTDAPPVWARFYDLETAAPIFTGRDRVPRARLDEIEYERRNGYGYLGTWPAKLLAKEYPA